MRTFCYASVDKTGQTINFLLTAPRDEQAAKRFLTKASRRRGVPAKITIDGSAANAVAITCSNEAHGTAIVIRTTKSLNNIVEIVLTQWTKTRHRAAEVGRDGLADFDVAMRDQHAINQECDQGTFVRTIAWAFIKAEHRSSNMAYRNVP